MKILYNKQDSRMKVPILVQTCNYSIIIELNAYDSDGNKAGSIYHTMERKDAIELQHSILAWACDTPYTKEEKE